MATSVFSLQSQPKGGASSVVLDQTEMHLLEKEYSLSA